MILNLSKIEGPSTIIVSVMGKVNGKAQKGQGIEMASGAKQHPERNVETELPESKRRDRNVLLRNTEE